MIEIDKTTGEVTFTLTRIGFMPEIERVIFNDPATVVFWKDGQKTVVKCQEGDSYNEQTGLLMCIAKRYFGNTGRFNDVLHEWVPCEKAEPSFDWEAFKKGEFAVHLTSEEAVNDFLQRCDDNGVVWGSGSKATDWTPRRERFFVRCDCADGRIFYGIRAESYEGVTITEWKPETE